MADRSELDQAVLDSVIDRMGPLELFQELHSVFGGRRTMELLGWASIWGILGVQSVAEMRLRWEETGMRRSAAYRAAAQFKEFGDHLLAKYGRELEVTEIVRALAVQGRPLSRIDPV